MDLKSGLALLKTRLTSEKVARRDSSTDTYWQMVHTSVDGGENDPADVIAVLADLDRTPEQFESDCEKLARRQELAAIFSEGGKRRGKLTAAERAVTAIRVKYDHAIAKMREELAVAEDEYQQSLHAVAEVDDSEIQLTRSAWPATLEKEAAVMQELKSLHSPLVNVKDRIREVESQIKNAERLLTETTDRRGNTLKRNSEMDEHHKAVVRSQSAELTRLKAQLGELEKRRIELDGQLHALHAEKMRP